MATKLDDIVIGIEPPGPNNWVFGSANVLDIIQRIAAASGYEGPPGDGEELTAHLKRGR